MEEWNNMYWIILFIAGLFEVGWAIGLKYTEGFTKLLPSVLTVACMIISMGLLAYSIKHLPIGTAYAIWTGIGAVGTAVLGIILFSESKELIRIFFIFLIVVGIVGLKIFSGQSEAWKGFKTTPILKSSLNNCSVKMILSSMLNPALLRHLASQVLQVFNRW